MARLLGMAVQPDSSAFGRDAGGNGRTPTKRRAPRGWRARPNTATARVERVERVERADGPSERERARVRDVGRATQGGQPLSTG